MKKVTYLETRFYDNGAAFARLWNAQPPQEKDSNKYDMYVDTIGKGQNYESLEKWAGEMEGSYLDNSQVIEDLQAGKTVNISHLC